MPRHFISIPDFSRAELNADYELVDCAEQSCGDSCAADDDDECAFAWP